MTTITKTPEWIVPDTTRCDNYDILHSQLKKCDRCQRMAIDNGKAMDDLHPVKVIPKVWYLVGVDLVDAKKVTASGQRYILTQTDYFSKYVEGMPLPDKSATSVAKALFKTFCRHGAPVHIITDQGREFVNQVWQSYLVF